MARRSRVTSRGWTCAWRDERKGCSMCSGALAPGREVETGARAASEGIFAGGGMSDRGACIIVEA